MIRAVPALPNDPSIERKLGYMSTSALAAPWLIALVFQFSGLAVISVRAQACDDACFLIRNTFGQETLRRYLDAFPGGRYVDLARARLDCLKNLGAVHKDEFGLMHTAPATSVPASQMPTRSLN